MVLVAAGSVSVVKLIFSLAVAINAAASKARRNRDDCLDIAARASTLDAALSALHDSAKAKHPAVGSALEGLHLALHRALQAVTDCQEDGAMSRLFNADRVSAELRRVNQVITDRMMDVILVAGCTPTASSCLTRTSRSIVVTGDHRFARYRRFRSPVRRILARRRNFLPYHQVSTVLISLNWRLLQVNSQKKT